MKYTNKKNYNIQIYGNKNQKKQLKKLKGVASNEWNGVPWVGSKRFLLLSNVLLYFDFLNYVN